jgi:type I restriction enzyme S subunit
MMSEKILVPQEYKMDDLRIIPDDWGLIKLSKVVFFQEGPGLRTWQFTKLGIRVLLVTNINPKRLNLSSKERYISIDEYENKYKHFTIEENDIVLASSGNSWGKVAIVSAKDLPLIVNTSTIRLHSKSSDELYQMFLYYFLESDLFIGQIEKLITGACQPNFGPFHLNKVEIPFPLFKEQEKIASIFSKVDEQIEQTEQIIERTELLKTGLMQKLLTKGIGHTKFKITEFGEIPEEWGIFQIDQLANINKESRDPTKNSEELFNYIDIDAVENGTGLIKNPKRLFGREAPSRARRVIQKDDVIMSTVRPYHKAFALVPIFYDNQICSTGFAVLSCGKNIDPRYLLQSLFSDQVIDQCTSMMAGGQYPALNTTQVSKIKVPIPPLPEQQKIASILSKVDSQIQDNQRYLNKLQELKKGLMQDLLTGKVRVTV